MTDGHTFVCYAREDRDFVRVLIADLRARGLRLFVDADIPPGADWDRTIDESLRACSNLLIVLSPAAVASDEARGELRAALSLAKPIVPLLYQACDLPRQLQNIQYLDFVGGNDTTAARDALAAALQSMRRAGEQDQPGLRGHAGRDLRNRRDFLDDVKNEAAGRLAQSLPSGALNLLKEKQPDQVRRRWDRDIRIPHQPSAALAADVRIVDVFDDEAIAGKLLILGAPGSGKTTTLLELSQELLRRAESDASEPMPVLCNLSSWKNDGDALSAWLVETLKVKYGVRKDYGFAWLSDGALVPLLDGLDEVAPEHQESCCEAINQFQSDYRPRHIVVCCRLAEYENSRVKLQLNGAIRLLPLADDQIRHYLAHAESEEVWHGISGDHETMALARSPLLLRLITVAYEESSPQNWQRPISTSERQMHLFDVYVRRVLADEATTQPYSNRQTIRWLAWLARTTKEQGQAELLIERMQPAWLESAAQRLLYQVGTFAVASIAVTLALKFNEWIFAAVPRGAVGLAYSQMAARTPAGAFWQAHDNLAIAMMGTAAGVTIAARPRIQPIETLRWSWTNGWRGMVDGTRNMSLGGLNFGAYVGWGAGLFWGIVELRDMFSAAHVDSTLRFNAGGTAPAYVVLLALGAATLWPVRPGAWLVGRAGDLSRGSTADAMVGGLAFAAATSSDAGLGFGVSAGVCVGCVLKLRGGSQLFSAGRFAEFLVIGLVSGLVGGAILSSTQTVKSGFADAVGVWTLVGAGVAASAALAVGLVGGFRRAGAAAPRSTSEPARRLTRAVVIGVIIAAIFALIVAGATRAGAMPLVRGVGVANARVGLAWTFGLLFATTLASVGAAIGTFIGAFLGALFGMLRGVTGPDVQRRTTPNQGIRQSAKNMGVLALVGALIVGLPYGLMNLGIGMGITRVLPSPADWLNLAASPAVLFGVIGASVPGAACVQHFTLRFVLWSFGLAPWRYVRFLNYATGRTLLQRVGGRYRFIHELLREHFAAVDSRSEFSGKEQF